MDTEQDTEQNINNVETNDEQESDQTTQVVESDESSEAESDLFSFFTASNEVEEEEEEENKEEPSSEQTNSEPEEQQSESQAAASPSLEDQLKETSLYKEMQSKIEALQAEKEVKPQQQAPAPKQYTKEEIDKLTGRITVTPELAQTVFGDEVTPTQVAALQAVLDNNAAHSFNMARMYADANLAKAQQEMQTKLKAYEQLVTPMQAAHQAQQADQVVNQFFTENPDLKGYESVVEVAADNVALKTKGQNISYEIAAKQVAELARNLLTKMSGSPATTDVISSNQAKQRTASKVPTMAKFTDGGRSQGKTVTKGNADSLTQFLGE